MSDISIIDVYNEDGSLAGPKFSVINGQIQFCNSLEALRQKIRNLLVTWTGQWFLNVFQGINYQTAIGRNTFFNLTPEIENKILALPGVSSIQSTNVNLIDGTLVIDLTIVANGQIVNINLQQRVN